MNRQYAESDLFANGIDDWAQKVRNGEVSFTHTVNHCLQRIKQYEKLNAFECLDTERALATATALDNLLKSGIDLGPLMGLPIGVKDIMAVEGLPTSNGSNADTSALTGSEGFVVNRLKRSGAIVLGKTRTVEFALGATGVNESRGTPWNPVDLDTHRIPGGSSSGSAVATSAALTGMGLGTDTGGSVRIPACLTGIVGHKTSVGLWPDDGVFSLSRTLDSIGPLCRCVNDAALLHTLITGQQVPKRENIKGLRLGIVEDMFFDDLDTQVADDFDNACQILESAGAHLVRLRFPEMYERTTLFTTIVPAELISFLTPERFNSIQKGVDTVTALRAAVGLNVSAHAYVSALRRRKELITKANNTFEQVDAWLSPTCPFVPMPLTDLESSKGHERALLASRNTQPGNLLDMCGLSLPMHTEGLPTGLQITMPLNQDANLLAAGAVIEACLSS